MGLGTQDIQREGIAKKQDPAVTLEQMFAREDAWNRKGAAFINVTYRGTNGGLYGSSKWVHKDCIEGREYELSQCGVSPRSVHLLFTDEKFNPRVNYKKPMRSLTCKEKA